MQEISRRTLLGSAATVVGAGILGGALAGCSPQDNATGPASNEQGEAPAGSSLSGNQAVDESQISETIEVDVAVIGLGVAGVAALRSSAEAGLRVIGVEKCDRPSARSSMFAAFNTDNARKLGIEDISTTELANELMVQMCHRADYRIIKQWADHCGEAFDWYANAYEGIQWIGPEDAYPEDPEQVYVANYEYYPPQAQYVQGRDHERTFFGCLSFGPLDHSPILEANVEKALSTGNAEVIFNAAGHYLEKDGDRVSSVVIRKLDDQSYVRINAAKGIVLATGGYTHNDEMMAKYAPWIHEHKERFFYSYHHMDNEGNYSDTGDGQIMGMQAGGHLDIGPHAIMAHSALGPVGVDAFLQLNQKGERYANEDLNTTHFSAIFLRQPGTKMYQIFDSKWKEQLPFMQPGLGNALDVEGVTEWYGEIEDWASATGNTLEELVGQLAEDDTIASTMLAEIERYNELCHKGVDEDFGKTPERLFPVEEAPFYAVVCDTEIEGNPNDVSGMRVLVSMSGLMTTKNAEAIDEDGNPIEGLYAIGNTQGGRFVDDYPATLSGASHASALTGGYLVGSYINSK